MENLRKKVYLGIVKDPVVKWGTVSFDDFQYHLRRASSNMYNNPQANFDRGVAAMIQAFKEIGPFNYVAIIGECGLPDIAISSQSFFAQEVEEKFNAANINVEVEGIAATTNKFWSEEVIDPLERDAGVKIRYMDVKSCEISQGEAYRYHFDCFNYDRDVTVYKLTKK